MKKGFLQKAIAMIAVATTITGGLSIQSLAAVTNDKPKENGLNWNMSKEILKHISDPVFPSKVDSIVNHGAIANDDKLDTTAIQETINEMSENGGGTVIVPSGKFDTGAITLKSNVNLCLQNSDSVLAFTKDINTKNYPIVFAHYEGSACYNYSPFIYANGQTNIAVTGKGKLDGQADEKTWWNWKTDKLSNTSVLRKMTDDGTPFDQRIMGDGYYLRPNFIQPINCTNVKIEGITIANSPMWEINPVLCKNVTVRGVNIDTHGYNNDGCDPENCNYVLIENCNFNTGDDCIAIKAGRNKDGRDLAKQGFPTQNIIIRNNTFADGHGGIACGSEMSGGIKNVFADNNTFDSPHLNYALRFKTNAQRGGTIENVYLRNSIIKSVGNAAVHATMLYDEGHDGDYLPQFKNITIENLVANGGEYGIFMEAFDEVPITGLVLKNIQINGCEKNIRALNWKDPVLENVTINGVKYPRPVDTKISGIAVPGNTVTGSSTLLGGNSSDLSYEWVLKDSPNGKEIPIGLSQDLLVPNEAIGKYIQFIAKDKDGNEDRSIEYKVLNTTTVFGIANNADLIRAVSKGYIDEHSNLDLNKPITNRDVAKELAKLWNLSVPSTAVAISDVSTKDKDYNAIASVVEKGMMNLKEPGTKGATGTLYNTSISNAAQARRTAFMPDAKVSREELGYIAILACGVPYNETLGTTPHYADTDQIDDEYVDNVGASEYFGFIQAQSGNKLNPKKDATMGDLIYMIEKISDFNNK